MEGMNNEQQINFKKIPVNNSFGAAYEFSGPENGQITIANDLANLAANVKTVCCILQTKHGRFACEFKANEDILENNPNDALNWFVDNTVKNYIKALLNATPANTIEAKAGH